MRTMHMPTDSELLVEWEFERDVLASRGPNLTLLEQRRLDLLNDRLPEARRLVESGRLQPRDHDDRLDRARAQAAWDLGDDTYADALVEVYTGHAVVDDDALAAWQHR